MKSSAVRLQHFGRFFELARPIRRALRLSSPLLVVPLPQVSIYYSGLSLDEGYGHLIDVVAQSKFAMVVAIFVLQAGSKVLFDIPKRNFCIGLACLA